MLPDSIGGPMSAEAVLQRVVWHEACLHFSGLAYLVPSHAFGAWGLTVSRCLATWGTVTLCRCARRRIEGGPGGGAGLPSVRCIVAYKYVQRGSEIRGGVRRGTEHGAVLNFLFRLSAKRQGRRLA